MRLLGAVLLAIVLLGGCSNRAERVYRRAELLFSQGQAAMAAAEYRRLAMEEPRSALADDALYKLGYLQREEFNSPLEAIKSYDFLATRYTASPYADDALLRILQLQGEELKDTAAARRTYRLITERFPKDVRVLSTAHLQLVKTFFACGKLQEADTEAKALLAAAPDQPRQCAAAMLIRARIAEKSGKQGDIAVKLFEQIVAKYPDTSSAAEAKRAIGWLYYGYKGEQLKAERLAKVRAARVITGVPALAAVNGLRVKPFAALSSLLAHQGVRATPEDLLAISGAAFDFFYDPDRPSATTTTLARNVLGLAAEQYGFGVNVWSAPSAEASFASVTQALSQGHPVMVPQADTGVWLIVTGYKPAEDQVYVLRPGGGGAVATSRQQFISHWARNRSGHTECVTGPYFQLSLGQRLKPPAPTALARCAAARAMDAMNQRELGGVPAGFRAYDLLVQQLAGVSAEDAAAKQRLREFAQNGLPAVLAERRAAVRALTNLAGSLPGDAQNQALQAAETYNEVIGLGQRLRSQLLSLTAPAQGAEPPPEVSFPEAADCVRQMRASEERALAYLAELAR